MNGKLGKTHVHYAIYIFDREISWEFIYKSKFNIKKHSKLKENKNYTQIREIIVTQFFMPISCLK